MERARRLLPLMILLAVLAAPGVVTGDEYNASDVGDLNAYMDSASNIPDLADTINIAAGIYSITSPIFYSDVSEASLALVGEGPGVTILDGNGTSSIFRINTFAGGGAAQVNRILIKDMTFRNAGTGLNGGAVWVRTHNAELLVDNVEFLNNATGGNGGGLYFETETGSSEVKGSYFFTNRALGGVNQRGGGYYALVNTSSLTHVFKLEEDDFTGNQADNGGGAFFEARDGQTKVERTEFTRNRAGTVGGGLYATTLGGQSEVVNNLFAGNGATLGGGLNVASISGEVYVVNNTAYANSASNLAGGLLLDLVQDTASASVVNNLFFSNSSAGGATDIYAGNDTNGNGIASSVDILYNNFSAAAVLDTDDGNVTIASNINTDPLFENAAGSDFRLSDGSPAIDAGDSAAMDETVDLAGNPRFVDDPMTADTGSSTGGTPVIDMGALEFQAGPSTGTGGGGGGGGCSTAGWTQGHPVWTDLAWLAVLAGLLLVVRKRAAR